MSSDQDVRQHQHRIRNGARWARIKRSAGLGLLSAAVAGFITPFAAESADNLQPPASFRHWFHVNTMVIDKGSPLFEAMGGMHNVYINSAGESALKKGEPYPDETVFLIDLHEFTVSDGSTVEGPRKADRHHAEGQEEVCLDGRLGLPGLGGRRSNKTIGHRSHQTMLRMPPGEERPGLRVFNLHPVSARCRVAS